MANVDAGNDERCNSSHAHKVVEFVKPKNCGECSKMILRIKRWWSLVTIKSSHHK